MNLLIDGTTAATLDDAAFNRVLTIYPEEEFSKRPVFSEALATGEIDFKRLKEEASRILVPWQMFLLDEPNLKAELGRIERLRHKVSKRLLAKRKGGGTTTSKRILDRLIRCQTYISDNHAGEANGYCGSLKGRAITGVVAHICQHFKIDRAVFWKKNKQDALSYLIEKFENGRINVCQGVLTNKLLPHLPGSRTVYKNTSGFVIRDASVPFAFIPSEINPDEREGRQILTLVFLVALIGLDAYDYQIDKEFKVSMLAAVGRQRLAYRITAEFLMPFEATEALRGTAITVEQRDELSRKYKLTPTAVVVILRIRDLITHAEYEALIPPPAAPGARSRATTPNIETSVRKFNGKYAFEYINSDLANGRISAVQTQYLLFGAINKKGFRQYRSRLRL